MIVCGLDQAPRHTGFCIASTEAGAKHVTGVKAFPSYGENELPLMRDVRRWATTLFELHRPDVVFMEQIVINRNDINLPVTYQQFAVVAALEAACEFIGCDCQMVDISVWRRRFLGRGHAPKWKVDRVGWLKERAQQVALEDLGLLLESHHAAEAAGIWDFGAACVDREYFRRTQAQRERRRVEMELQEREAA